MNDSTDKTQLLAKKKTLKVLMTMMLVFMVLSPLLGQKIFAEDFSKLKGAGLYFFYIFTPAMFGALFIFYLILYRRTETAFINDMAGVEQSPLSANELAIVRKARQRFRVGCVLVFMVQATYSVIKKPEPHDVWLPITGGIFLIAAIFGMAATWRYSRLLKCGLPLTVFNTLLMPVLFLIPWIVLVRVHAKQMGTKPSFWGDD